MRAPGSVPPPAEAQPATAVVVLNPLSGGGRGVRLRPRIEAAIGAAGIDGAVHVTTEPGHATDLAREAATRGVDIIVAVGGDGTVHEIANGMLDAATPEARTPSLAVVPVGTGNDFAKLLGVYGSIDRALHTIGAGTVRRFDAGRAEWEGGARWFVNAMGTGIDVEVVRQILRHRRLPGALSYVAGLARALVRYRAVPITMRASGQPPFQGSIMTIAVSNGRCVGGTFHICPESQPDDGLFDVCVIRELSLLGSLGTAARIVRGRHVGRPGVTVVRSPLVEIDVDPSGGLFFQLDGELHEPASARTIRLRVCPGVLPVRVASPAS